MVRVSCKGATIAGFALFFANPVLADTKAGVDAWAMGQFATAVRLWQVEAGKGDADALFNMGQAYRMGKGVGQDLAMAESLYGRAAALGHVQAADNYGLLMFQRGQRQEAIPYLLAAADRGDPRARYLIGLAHFNGDFLSKDWVRAYALVTLASQQGLPPATSALTQMDAVLSADQRQQANVLARELSAQAESARARNLAGMDRAVIADGAAGPGIAARPVVAPHSRSMAAADSPTAPAIMPQDGAQSAATAGADYARPAIATQLPRTAAASVATGTRPVNTATRPAQTVNDRWRIQLGAFGVKANADALWARLRKRPELAGHARLDQTTGNVIKLMAAGFASQNAAAATCAQLKAAGFACIPVGG